MEFSFTYSDAGYERQYPEGSFPYGTSNYVSQPIPSASAPPAYHAPQLSPMAYPPNQRPGYDDQAGPYLNVGSTPIPEITDWTPMRGSRDTKVHVYFTTLYELMTASRPIFFLKFGNRKCQASLQKLTQSGGVCSYTVNADAPPFSATGTGFSTTSVPLVLFMESGDGDVMATVNIGDFTYVDGGIQSGSSTPQEVSRKRKISADSAELMKSPAKRPSSVQLRPKEEYGTTYGYSPADGNTAYSPYLQPSTSYGGIVTQYGGSRSASAYHG